MNSLAQRTRLPFEPSILALAGGTGGVGTSSVAWAFARELLRRERSVLLVDLDLYAPTHILRLGELPERSLEPITFDEAGDDWRSAIRSGSRRDPDLLTCATARRRPMLRPTWRASQLIASLRATSYDYVLLDLPGTADPVHASLFALADFPTLVTTTEPAALLSATHLIRTALVYGLLHHPKAEQWERPLIDAVESVPWDADRSAIEYALRQRNAPAEIFTETLERFRFSMVLNQVRDVAEGQLAESLALAWGVLFGNRPNVAGTIDYDAQRWFHLRSGESPDYEFGDTRAERIRELVARATQAHRDASHTFGYLSGEPEGLELLGLTESCDAAEARARYRLLWEGFRRQSALTRVLVDHHLREEILGRLERANSDVIRKLPAATEEDPASTEPPRVPRPAPAAQLEQARRKAGVSRRELSLQTRVGLRYVEAICEYRIDRFPREVYLRGYLTELARVLHLDAEQFVADYLAAVHEDRQRNRLGSDS